MIVLKFGGTSVGSATNIGKVLDILLDYQKNGKSTAVVLSAVGGMTNKLIEMSQMAASKNEGYIDLFKQFEQIHFEVIRGLISVREQSTIFAQVKRIINELEDILQGVFLINELSPKTLDLIVSHGERLSTYITSVAAQEKGLSSVFVDARDIIKTNSQYGSAKVDFEATNQGIKACIDTNKGKIAFITGFIASDSNGATTTLGRGGSDYTAAIVAAAVDADSCEIWTDVDGVMTADPRKVKNAFTLPAISYNEAMEMSHFGAKVIYPPTLQPVFAKKIPIWIKNTFNPTFPGTYISDKTDQNTNLRIKGISSINEVSLINMQGSGMVGVPGVSARLFGTLAKNNINLILITQASSEHSICFAIDPNDGAKAKKLIDEEFYYEIQAGKIDQIHVETNLSVVAIIGENMMNWPGIAGKMFGALGKNGINVIAIAQGSSELNISTVIPSRHISKALNVLHDAFFVGESRTANVFLIGPGLIGKTLLHQIHTQHDYLDENIGLNIKVTGIINSRKALYNADGIDLNNWENALELAPANVGFKECVEAIKAMNLSSSIVVDCTAGSDIASLYNDILDSSISVVTPNKIANSGTYSYYQQLKQTAQKRGVKFLYETNVGAGLPVIRTLQDLINSGDEIVRIEGILSGTLSFIFNNYTGDTTFKEIVKKAKDLGYTEPDPRDDLSGKDVARKILILARESGLAIEPEDVVIESFLPKSCVDAPSVDAFFTELEKEDSIFKALADKARAGNGKLRCIATLENGKISIGIRIVGTDHPFYALSGSDNMISYTTRRYLSNPLVIKGPGAGAEVTAAGVFADIITVCNTLS